MSLASVRLGPMCVQFQSTVGIEACRLRSRTIMLSKWLFVSCLVLIVQDISADTGYIDVAKYSKVFYDPNTGLILKGALEDANRSEPVPRIGFRGVKCNCEGLSCGCCAGINITRFNFDRRACTNFTYIPEDFAIKLKLIINEKEILSSGALSAKNPAPFCVPFYPPFISFCVRFFDIYTSGKNLHTCVDFETLVVTWPILILHFDCIKIGADGIAWTKPESNVLLTAEVNKPEVNGPEIYDQVDFELDSVEFPNNYTSSMKPEEEDNIGQLKL